MDLSCARGSLGWTLRKISSWKEGEELEQAAQGEVGVTIPEGVQEKNRSVTEGHGLVMGLCLA